MTVKKRRKRFTAVWSVCLCIEKEKQVTDQSVNNWSLMLVNWTSDTKLYICRGLTLNGQKKTWMGRPTYKSPKVSL